MSTEDRVRAATRARTDLVRQVRPLELPDELPARGRRSRHARPARDPRRWLTWGAPLAAAALVMGVALTLVLLRQAPASQPGPVTSTSASPVPSAIPRYYVALAFNSARTQMQAEVVDDQTGRTVAVVNPPATQSFNGVTGAADDRTFVLVSGTYNSPRLSTFYLLRFTPGAAHPTQLTELPIQPVPAIASVAAHMSGLALSPDGRELAVMWASNNIGTNPVTSLTVYSMSSGAVLHTWITRNNINNSYGGGANAEALAWVDGDRSLDFRWMAPPDYNWDGSSGPTPADSIRTIDVTAPGGDLLADSREVLRLPVNVTADKTKAKHSWLCITEVTAGDGTVVCGTSSSAPSFVEVCSTVPPSFVTYSGTTGKRLKVLYQWHGQCLYAVADPLWTDSGGRHVIAYLFLSDKGIKTSLTSKVGLIVDGKFTPLPKLVSGGDLAF